MNQNDIKINYNSVNIIYKTALTFNTSVIHVNCIKIIQ